MQWYLFSLAFLAVIFVEYASTKSFTVDLDPSLSRHPRDVQSAIVQSPLSLHVASKISSRFANTLVTRTLENKSPKNQEAKFAVQLPETAFISNFSMVVNGKQYNALVKERKAATDEYDNAKKKGQTNPASSTGSLQAVRMRGMDVFEIAISVAPNSSAEFRLSYQQLLVRRKGYYEQAISIRPKQIIPVLKVVVDIEEPQALSYVGVMKIRKNPSDALEKGNPLAVVTYPSPTSVHIEYNPNEDEQRNQESAGVDGDFIVRYNVYHGNDVGIMQVLGPYFVQYFSPTGLNPLSKHVVFVVDVTGPMSGQIRQAMLAILNKFREGDSIYIYMSGCALMSTRYPIHIEKVKKYIDECIRPGGNLKPVIGSSYNSKIKTNVLDSLPTTLSQLSHDATHFYRKSFSVVLLLTDVDPTILQKGMATPRETDPKTIRANLRRQNKAKVSIFALGLGFNVNMDFLAALSVESGGKAYRVHPGKDVTSQVVGYFDQVSTCMLRRVTFEYPNGVVDDSRTTAWTFAQYQKGSELVVSGKIKEGVTNSRLMSVNIRGNTSNSSVAYTLSRTLHNLTVPSDKVLIEDFTERLWAYMRIKQLLVKLLITDDPTEHARLKNEALQMSLQYNFVTPLTSLVVVQKESENAVAFIYPSLKRESEQSPSAGWRLSSTRAPTVLLIVAFLRF